MAATQFPGASKGARQAQRLGVPYWLLTPAALSLLQRRRRVRLVAVWSGIVPVLALLVVTSWQALRLPAVPTAPALRAYGLRAGAATAVFGLACLTQSELQRRLERRMARSLPTRVSRTEQVSTMTVLGRVRAGCLLVVLLGQLVLAAALSWVSGRGMGAFRWGVWIAVAGCVTAAVLGVVREVRRPAVAVDAVSLTLDERLRSENAFTGAWPLVYLGCAQLGSLQPIRPPGWLDTLHLGIVVASALALVLGLAAAPWRPLPGLPRLARAMWPAR